MVSAVKKSSNSKNILLNSFLAIVFIVLVAVTVVIRIRTLAVSLERDEGEYAYAGQLILQGVPPYSLAYNMKMPGIYAAYALILACFGQTQSGIHLGVLVINTATILFIFLIAKKLFGPIAGLASAVFFAITSIGDTVQATANAENFVIFFATAGILLLMNYADSKKYFSLAAGGLLMGISFMMKQHGAGFILFGLFLLIYDITTAAAIPKKRRKPATEILIYCFFAALPFLITCLILWQCGVFEKFWFWTFDYAGQYASLVPVVRGIRNLKAALNLVVPSAWFIWLFCLTGISAILWNKEIYKRRLFLCGLLVFSFLAVCPGLYFRPHYFVLFLPALSIIAGAGIIAIQDLLAKKIKSAVKTQFVLILIIMVIWLQSFYSQKDYLLETDLVEISRYNFGLRPFPESLEIAKFIKNRSNNDDKIAVLGSEPQIYFYSHRRSATSYLYTYPLMESHPYAADMQREMISQIETNKPRFIVLAMCFDSWLLNPDSEKLIFNWMSDYVISHYKKIGLVEMFTMEKTLYTWDANAAPTKPEGWLMVYERIK